MKLLDDIRWWLERYVVQLAYFIWALEFPVRIDVEWTGFVSRRAFDDMYQQWGQREFVQYYVWTYNATPEERAEHGKTEYGTDGDDACDSR